jgi:hypothetical protein
MSFFKIPFILITMHFSRLLLDQNPTNYKNRKASEANLRYGDKFIITTLTRVYKPKQQIIIYSQLVNI